MKGGIRSATVRMAATVTLCTVQKAVDVRPDVVIERCVTGGHMTGIHFASDPHI